MSGLVRREWKFVIFWTFGALAITFGSVIAGNIRPGLGVSETGLLIAFILAFVLILVGGLLWISVALAMKKVHDE